MTDFSHTVCGLSLRSEEPGEREFLVLLIASTREEELLLTGWTSEQKAAFYVQQFHAQTMHYERFYPGLARNIVLVDGIPAGRLYLFRNATDLRIVDISLLPQQRGRGLGTALIHSVFDHADSNGLSVSLHVGIFNPARQLYERLGFQQAEDDGVYILMRRAAQSQTASSIISA